VYYQVVVIFWCLNFCSSCGNFDGGVFCVLCFYTVFCITRRLLMFEARVVKLPTELHRMREAERLVCRWHEIQQIKVSADRVAALFEWRVEMQDHAVKFSNCVK
jgi:hypothetical protein